MAIHSGKVSNKSSTSKCSGSALFYYFFCFTATSDVWTGLNDLFVPGMFTWSDEHMVTFTYWAPGEPNNHDGFNEDCVEMSHQVMNTQEKNLITLPFMQFYDIYFQDLLLFNGITGLLKGSLCCCLHQKPEACLIHLHAEQLVYFFKCVFLN